MKFFSENILLNTRKIIIKIEHAIIFFSLKRQEIKKNKK